MALSSNILRIDSSARCDGSVSRKLADQIIERVGAANAQLTNRDLGSGLDAIDSD